MAGAIEFTTNYSDLSTDNGKHCTQCGAKLEPSAKFCSGCGAPAALPRIRPYLAALSASYESQAPYACDNRLCAACLSSVVVVQPDP